MDSNLPVLAVPQLAATERLVSLPRHALLDARNGAPPRLATALRVGLRGRTLCVRFDGQDDGIVATRQKHDEPLWTEDVFEVFLAPSEATPTTYYEIEVNPLGASFDARVESPDGRRETMRVETAWECPKLRAEVTRRQGRWSASLRIPLETLGGGDPPTRWRANFYRIDRGMAGRPDEYSAWSPTWVDPPDFHRPERFGILNFGP